MERIVIVSENAENDTGFIELLNAFFTECEVITVLPTIEGSKAHPNGSLSGFRMIDKRGGKRVKHFDCR